MARSIIVLGALTAAPTDGGAIPIPPEALKSGMLYILPPFDATFDIQASYDGVNWQTYISANGTLLSGTTAWQSRTYRLLWPANYLRLRCLTYVSGTVRARILTGPRCQS